MPRTLTHQGQVLLRSFSAGNKGAFSPYEYHSTAPPPCRSSKHPIQQAALRATCTVPVHLEGTLGMGEGVRGAHETTILAPRRTLSDVLKERTNNDSLSLSRSSSNSENELGAVTPAMKGKSNDLESSSRATDTDEAKGEQQDKGSRMAASSKMKALENLALPQLHAAVKMALEIRRRRGRESTNKAEQPRQELPDDSSVTSSPTAKQAAQTLSSIMASSGTDDVREEGQESASADDGNKDGNNNMDLPKMQDMMASRKRKRDFQPSPSRLRRMSSLATEMSNNLKDGNPASAPPGAVISSNPGPGPMQQQEHQAAPDMRRVAITNSAAIRVFKAARQGRMMRALAPYCDDATSVPRPSAMPGASEPPQQEPTRRQADLNKVWEAAVRVFQASHAQQQLLQQQGAQGGACPSMQNKESRSSDLSWTDAMKAEHRHLFKAIAEARRHSRAGCL